MNEVLNYSLESVVSLGLFWLFYKLVIEKENLLNFGRFYLISASVLSLIFPLIRIQFPSQLLPVSQVTDDFILYLEKMNIQGEQQILPETSTSLLSVILWIYSASVAVMFTILITRLFRTFKFIRSQEQERSGRYVLLKGSNEFPSFSLFNYIFIRNYNELPAIDRVRILEHEKVHADQLHTVDLLYFELLSVIFWFNPFVWFYKNLIVDVHEYLADKKVINTTGPEGYSGLLVRQAIGISSLRPANYFKNSSIIKRLKKMKTYGKRKNKYIAALSLPVIAVVFFTISGNGQILKKPADDSIGPMALLSTIWVTALSTDDAIIKDAGLLKTDGIQTGETIVNNPIDTVDYKNFSEVDVMPEPYGGKREFYELLGINIRYPDNARKTGVEGTVLVGFIVDQNGDLRNVRVLKGVDPECDKDVVRIVSLSPPWKPGIKDGQPVAVKLVLPIVYKLE